MKLPDIENRVFDFEKLVLQMVSIYIPAILLVTGWILNSHLSKPVMDGFLDTFGASDVVIGVISVAVSLNTVILWTLVAYILKIQSIRKFCKHSAPEDQEQIEYNDYLDSLSAVDLIKDISHALMVLVITGISIFGAFVLHFHFSGDVLIVTLAKYSSIIFAFTSVIAFALYVIYAFLKRAK